MDSDDPDNNDRDRLEKLERRSQALAFAISMLAGLMATNAAVIGAKRLGLGDASIVYELAAGVITASSVHWWIMRGK